MRILKGKSVIAAGAACLITFLPTTAAAQSSSAALLPASPKSSVAQPVDQNETCSQNSSETKSEKQKILDSAQEEYETFDLQEEIAKDLVQYQENISIIENSSALVEYFDKYSDFPMEDRQRLAASTPRVVVQEIATNLEGKALLLHPSTGSPEVVPQDEADKYDIFPSLQKDPCWKSYVGACTAAVVTGFYCGLGGPITMTACTIGVAAGGTHVDWNRYC
ncbi:hypothetical protein [Corynebacterium meridianum]|uniref:Secreted protein n=1 Tax=Corynebacterium meridianum TaxID=2765363 RepID=A0A934HYB7_9CORY|nr:hypothetical protein [Corynebacterium meridianum]MBI8988842.1 hypothetical protein [Corynebacterium meridianum]